jgi:hypothetical protein
MFSFVYYSTCLLSPQFLSPGLFSSILYRSWIVVMVTTIGRAPIKSSPQYQFFRGPDLAKEVIATLHLSCHAILIFLSSSIFFVNSYSPLFTLVTILNVLFVSRSISPLLTISSFPLRKRNAFRIVSTQHGRSSVHFT